MLCQRFIGSHMADVHTPLRREERLASWLISETPYLFKCSLFSQCTLKMGPKVTACSPIVAHPLAHIHTITLSSRCPTQLAEDDSVLLQWKCRRWPSLPVISSFAVCPDFPSAWEGKIREIWQLLFFRASINTFRHYCLKCDFMLHVFSVQSVLYFN